MMLGWHLWQLIVVILTIHSHIKTVLAVPPFAEISPVSQTVFVNNTVDFQCQIKDTANYQRLIWISDYDSTDEVVHYIAAEESTDVETSGEGHGNYSVDYYESLDEFGEYTVHHLTLRIEGVMLPDEGQYACGYLVYFTDQFGRVVDEQLRFLGDKANLTILEPPQEGNPSCTFIPDPLTLSSAESSVMVTMTCQINGGRPLPSLTWYKKDTVISQVSGLNVLHYELPPEDNGVEFMCIASGPALVIEGSCSVFPLQINPSVFITSSVHMPTQESADLKLTCEGSGMPMVSKLDWLYNGQALPNINNMELKYQIVDISDSLSELHLFNVQYDHDNDVVTCYVEVPSGLNSQTSVTIMVAPEKTTMIATGKPVTTNQQTSMHTQIKTTIGPPASSSLANALLTIVIPLAIVCVILLIIVAVFVRCWQMKRRKNQCSPDDAYVISELPREHHTTAMTTDHLYEDRISPSVDSTSNVENSVNHSVDHVDDHTPSYERHIPFVCIEESQNQNPPNEGIYIDIDP